MTETHNERIRTFKTNGRFGRVLRWAVERDWWTPRYNGDRIEWCLVTPPTPFTAHDLAIEMSKKVKVVNHILNILLPSGYIRRIWRNTKPTDPRINRNKNDIYWNQKHGKHSPKKRHLKSCNYRYFPTEAAFVEYVNVFGKDSMVIRFVDGKIQVRLKRRQFDD